ncbi:unnamed protein product, partial [Effrenium voratum]
EVIRQQIWRNFPQEGDTTGFAYHQEAHPQEVLVVTRPDGESTFRICSVFRMPVPTPLSEINSPDLGRTLESFHHIVVQILNRPGIEELRQIDKEFYITLSMRHFKRGPPLLPVDSQHERVDVRLGEKGTPSCWTRFEGNFQLARYLQLFIGRLGYKARTFDTMDGHQLVPYQCVMRRDEWLKVREEVLGAFGQQKAAYRRCNGGTTAPDLREDVVPNVRPGPCRRTKEDPPMKPRVVVRRTFIDIDECVDQEVRRTKSVMYFTL